MQLFLFLVILLTVMGCSTVDSSFAKKAVKLGFQTQQIQQIQGMPFKHVVYINNSSNTLSLHVYLGGDGTPWLKGRYINYNPTPVNPVMLSLMKMDKSATIYLGRPCYHQQKMPSECHSSLWTNRRYSPVVVKSMVVALESYIKQKQYKDIKLFGFSGGGTLAMLIAARLQAVSTVVTLAGNLDIDAWTTHHGYLPLTGSLNPAQQMPLPAHIQQFHLVGDLDKNVPIFITKPVVLKQKNVHYRRLAYADHTCCWKSIWLSLLSEI